jgi:hypothetical protein
MKIEDEKDDLWRLLGKVREPQVSPFFSRDVLRAIREEAPVRVSVLDWLRRRWRVAAIGLSAVALAGGFAWRAADQPDHLAVLAQEVSSSPDYHVITHLDELLDSEQSSVWLETASY